MYIPSYLAFQCYKLCAVVLLGVRLNHVGQGVQTAEQSAII
jgi:hypothetical protein